eukprot:TRINITY_DN11177_c0_g1::TRINITY_DN11177_c0_g1_i1::g.6555::m.6555 TRINITY_DN11177_c0_g1::TRINITY_DN11177_c0_g1_i1::g.6555  ORF type:complete len:439 (+),score=46.67,Glyoxalase_2/PF12681.2/0.0035,Glyoxalase_2/PF12681.2/0.012,Glyoxalase_2/PF12681.2/3.6,Glyoxalase/PF00903.20/0.022,Glyoxalase/PF00903.20/0.0069,Glyoxalase_4/PF13669.1/47,Glyoxalase_4/PF13669.1/0.0041 TRINITY_DN11177_c0_g1_i1:84-1400(+)
MSHKLKHIVVLLLASYSAFLLGKYATIHHLPTTFNTLRIGHISVETHDLTLSRPFYREIIGIPGGPEPLVEDIPEEILNGRDLMSKLSDALVDTLRTANPFLVAGATGTMLSFLSLGEVHHDFVLVYETNATWYPQRVPRIEREYPKFLAFGTRKKSDVDKIASSMKAAGVTVYEGRTMWGGDLSISFLDPDNRNITIYHSEAQTPSSSSSLSQGQVFSPFISKDIAIHVRDLSRAFHWYTTIIGLQECSYRPRTDSIIYLTGSNGLETLALIQATEQDHFPRHNRGFNHLAFELVPASGLNASQSDVLAACDIFRDQKALLAKSIQSSLPTYVDDLLGPVIMRMLQSIIYALGTGIDVDKYFTPLLYGPVYHAQHPLPKDLENGFFGKRPMSGQIGGNYAHYLQDPDGHSIEMFCGIEPYAPNSRQRFQPEGKEILV